MWFICLRRSIIDRDKWTTTLDEHLAWMKQQHEAGRILFSGPGHGEDGTAYGIYLIRCGAEEEARSANPITMTAGLVAMELFDQAAVTRVNALAKRAMDGTLDAIRSTGFLACVTGGGSMFRVHLKERPPRNYREAFATPQENRQLKVLLDHLFDEGLMMINTCSATISTPMGESEIDALVAALKGGFTKVMAAV